MNLLDKILEVKANLTDGISLEEQIVGKYITENMKLEIIEFKIKRYRDEDFDEAKITAKNEFNIYEFEMERYPIYNFSPEEYQLHLKLIKSLDSTEMLELKKTFYTSFFKEDLWEEYAKPLSDRNSNIDHEMSKLIDIMKNKLENSKLNVTKSILDVKNTEPILVNIDDNIKIRQGFSNTYQVSLEKIGFSNVNLIFRKVSEERLNNELDLVVNLIEAITSNHLIVNGIDLFELKRKLEEFSLDEERVWIQYNTEGILAILGNKSDKNQLITSFGLGEYESIKEMKVKLYYDIVCDQLELNINYMLNEFTETFNNVDDMFKFLNTIKGYLE